MPERNSRNRSKRSSPLWQPYRLARGVLGCLLAVGLTAAEASGATATATIDGMHAGFVEVMKRADELGFAGRFEALLPIVSAAYDLPFMATKSLGSNVDALSEADRQRWIESFGRFITADYARRFQAYSGQRFESVGETAAPHDQVVVQSHVVRADGEEVRLDYRLRKTPDGWRIIDIYAKGTTSLLSVRRAEFSGFIEQNGIDALVASVDEKAAEE